jgi:hypothetical protein
MNSGDHHSHTNRNFSSDASGVDLIHAERERQVQDEGYGPDGDDDYVDGQLPLAAVSYAKVAAAKSIGIPGPYNIAPPEWPWDPEWWKPSPSAGAKDAILDLVKAGALIAAEIDRLQRIRANEESAAPVVLDGHATSEG